MITIESVNGARAPDRPHAARPAGGHKYNPARFARSKNFTQI